MWYWFLVVLSKVFNESNVMRFLKDNEHEISIFTCKWSFSIISLGQTICFVQVWIPIAPLHFVLHIPTHLGHDWFVHGVDSKYLSLKCSLNSVADAFFMNRRYASNFPFIRYVRAIGYYFIQWVILSKSFSAPPVYITWFSFWFWCSSIF